MESKHYRSHSTYPGHLKETHVKEVLMNHPERIILKAVHGMLPRNKLRDLRMKRLKIYPDDSHPHQAQLTFSILPDHISEVWKAFKWVPTAPPDPNKHMGSFVEVVSEDEDWVVRPTVGPGTSRYKNKRDIKYGPIWKRPRRLLKSQALPLTFKQIISKAERKGKLAGRGTENVGLEDQHKTYDDLTLTTPPDHQVFGTHEEEFPRSIQLKPPAYPRQKNLKTKIRSRWLQRQEAAQQRIIREFPLIRI